MNTATTIRVANHRNRRKEADGRCDVADDSVVDASLEMHGVCVLEYVA